MSVHERRDGLVPGMTSQLLAGAGLFGFVTFLYMLFTDTRLATGFVAGRLLEVFLLVVPSVGLVYAGYWLYVCDLDPDQLRQVRTAAVAGVVLAAVATGLALVAAGGVGSRPAFFLFVSTGTEGALLGVLVGVLAVTDILRRRDRELTERGDRFAYVERAADIGFWELGVTDSRPGAGTDSHPDGAADATMSVSDGVRRLLDVDERWSLDVERVLDLCHPEDRERVAGALDRAVRAAEPFDVEARLTTADGSTRRIRMTGEPASDGAGVRGVLRDVTEQRERERTLERKTERLEEFASVVSHDLRNPLGVAQGRLELAREECDSDHLHAVERAHARMETLIEDLLVLARAGAEATDLEPVDLAAVVEGCWRNVPTGAATLAVETERRVRADRSRLEQLLENLMRNAVEHGGPEVTVTVGDLPDGFYVADDGVGIPGSDRETVFGNGYSTGTDKTGFGLSIVENIVDAHGWTVAVTDSADGGARFEITGVERA